MYKIFTLPPSQNKRLSRLYARCKKQVNISRASNRLQLIWGAYIWGTGECMRSTPSLVPRPFQWIVEGAPYYCNELTIHLRAWGRG